MARKPHIPAYRLHRPSGQARVIIGGRHCYLGKHGSDESLKAYSRLIAEHLNGHNPEQDVPRSTASSLLVKELILHFWRFVESHYIRDGKPTDEQAGIRAALRFVRRLFGDTLACDFGPKALKTVRESMIETGHSRKYINDNVNRIRRRFKWSTSEELLPVTVYQALQTVDGLKKGRSRAKETVPVRPVSDEHIMAVVNNINPVVAAMIEVQLLAGMRPQDVRNMRNMDVDTSRDVWTYIPLTHKMAHRGMTRRIAIGPRAQAVLQPHLKAGKSASYVFSPRDAVLFRIFSNKSDRCPRKDRRKQRRPRPLSQHFREQYGKRSYEQAIARACKRAGVAHWTPNQLRHSCATKVRSIYGAEGAAAVLGNSLGMVVEIYAESNFKLAVKIMGEIG